MIKAKKVNKSTDQIGDQFDLFPGDYGDITYTVNMDDVIDSTLYSTSYDSMISTTGPTVGNINITTTVDDYLHSPTMKEIQNQLDAINERLAILQPNPEHLEKFDALREAYEHYKTLEGLIKNG